MYLIFFQKGIHISHIPAAQISIVESMLSLFLVISGLVLDQVAALAKLIFHLKIVSYIIFIIIWFLDLSTWLLSTVKQAWVVGLLI